MKKLKLSRAQVRVSHFAGSNDTLKVIKESGGTYNILMPVMKYEVLYWNFEFHRLPFLHKQ